MLWEDPTLTTFVESPLILKSERLSYISNSTDSGVVMDEEERSAQRAALGGNDHYDAPWAAVFSPSASTRRSPFSSPPSSCAQNDLGEPRVTPTAEEGPASLATVQRPPRPRSIDSRESSDEEDDGCTVIQNGMDGDLDKILSFSLQVLHGMELSTLEQSSQKHLCHLLTIDLVEALERSFTTRQGDPTKRPMRPPQPLQLQVRRTTPESFGPIVSEPPTREHPNRVAPTMVPGAAMTGGETFLWPQRQGNALAMRMSGSVAPFAPRISSASTFVTTRAALWFLSPCRISDSMSSGSTTATTQPNFPATAATWNFPPSLSNSSMPSRSSHVCPDPSTQRMASTTTLSLEF